MAPLKRKGDLAELAVAADLVRQGYRVLLPFGEECDFDVAIIRGDRIERVQVKYVTPVDGVLPVRCRSHSLTNGKVRAVKKYTCRSVDWLAAYNAADGRCFYIPASELGAGRAQLQLRLTPARNGQQKGIRRAADYTTIPSCEPR
jgi:hypothetical protein